MCPDLGADPVSEWRDDLPARCIVFRIRGKHHHYVQRETYRVSLDLNVPLLQDIEQTDLDLASQIGELIDGEDPSVGARQQAVMDRELVRKIQSCFGCPDRIYVTDHVGDCDIGSCQLFNIALFPVAKTNRQVVPHLFKAPATGSADRGIG